MQKRKINKFSKEDRRKVLIRADRHLQRIKLSGLLTSVRKEFGIPDSGFDTVEAFETWQKNNLDNDKEVSNKWQEALQNALRCAKLSEDYINSIETYIALDFQAFDVNLPEIPHHRTDKNYSRATKLIDLYGSINPKTGKKYTAQEVSDAYLPLQELSDKKYDQWIEKYSIGSGDAVRKIVSRYKKRLLK